MKLDYEVSTNIYRITDKSTFNGNCLDTATVMEVFDFAYAMVYGVGQHRSTRSGGDAIRQHAEKFCNTLQGKLAELIVFKMLQKNGLKPDEIDFSVHPEGIWDTCDLNCNQKRINIKSTAFFSNLFLLECADWSNNGNYKPNIEDEHQGSYDYFVMVRIKPDLKGVFRAGGFFTDEPVHLSKQILQQIIAEQQWYFDVPGYFTNDMFKQAIANEQILPRGARLNGTVTIDASNYYIQAGELNNFHKLVVLLKSE